MFNNILPAMMTTAVMVIGAFLIWCVGIGADQSYFFEWLPMVLLAAMFLAVMWGLSEGDASVSTPMTDQVE